MNINEIHIFELRNEEINVKKILAVNNETYAVTKRKPEKSGLHLFLHSAVQIYEFHIYS